MKYKNIEKGKVYKMKPLEDLRLLEPQLPETVTTQLCKTKIKMQI